MKGYRNFIIVFSVLFILYIVAEINRPKPVNWDVTLSRTDKNPYGGYIVYEQLKTIFPNAAIQSYRTSVYHQVNNSEETNTAYFIIGSALRPSSTATYEMKNYVSKGNYIIASANLFNTPFLDSFNIETTTSIPFVTDDSTSLYFTNPALKSLGSYTFLKGSIDQSFSKIDTAKTIVLSVNNHKRPVFVKVPYGKGAFFFHADPLCFSNYFLLFRNNASYASTALSYIPSGVSKIYWDENEKFGPEGPRSPLRFFLSNEYLRWSLRLAMIGLFLYVLFEMKRRQRVIPVITPLKNTTLDFIRTVAGVYYNEKDNRSIAEKKVNYFLEFIRNRFNLATNQPDEDFTEQLQRKSGVDKEEVSLLVQRLNNVPLQQRITDNMLIDLDTQIDKFYKQIK